ncbi:MAG: hypothetical protein ABWY03_01380 [Microbacterium sp.]
MPLTAAASRGLDDEAAARLRALGVEVTRRGAVLSIADALAAGTFMAVADRGPDAAADLAAACDALADTEGGPVTCVAIPAALPLQTGPVAVLSSAGAVSAYELYVGAAIAAASGRRVEHLNGRGTLASTTHSGIAGRVLARSAAPAWHELVFERPERSLHELTSRPAAIVASMPPGTLDAARLIADHPDADVFLVFDRAGAQHGAAVAQQVSAMVELAFSIGATTAPSTAAEPEPLPPTAPSAPQDDELPPIRAADVVHVRLTSDALELTNRTRLHLRARVSLGSARDPHTTRAVFEAPLAPGEVHAAPTAGAEGLAALTPPIAVLRHWSHESEEVFEGGEQRILEFGVQVLDSDGAVCAEGTYRPGNGLDYFVTARDLTGLLGRSLAPRILPQPAPAVASDVPVDLLGALASAVAVGAGALAFRTTDL